MSGIEFLAQVRASENKVPFGFITSEASAAIKELAMDSGASFLITKPFSPEAMQEALSPFWVRLSHVRADASLLCQTFYTT